MSPSVSYIVSEPGLTRAVPMQQLVLKVNRGNQSDSQYIHVRMQQYTGLAGEHLLIHISPIINRGNNRLIDQLAEYPSKFYTRQRSRKPIEMDG